MFAKISNRVAVTAFLLVFNSPAQLWAAKYYPRNPSVQAELACVSRTQLSCFDLTRQQRSWFTPDAAHWYEPVIALDQVLAGSDSGLQARNKHSGELIWQQPLLGQVFSPSIEDDAFVGTLNQGLARVALHDGQILWQQSFEGWVYSPAIFADRLIVGGQAAKLWAVDKLTGKSLWQQELSQELVFAPLAVNSAEVVITTFDGSMQKFSIEDGREIWRQQFSVPMHTPTVYHNTLYARDFSGNLRAVNIEDGKTEWEFAAKAKTNPFVTQKLLIMISESNAITVVDRFDGVLLKKFPQDIEVISEPFIHRGNVFYFGAKLGKQIELRRVFLSVGDEYF